MTMGVFVASMPRWGDFRPQLGGNDDGDRERFLADIRSSVDVAKRLNSKHMTIVPGFMDRKLPVDLQTARVIDVLRRARSAERRVGKALCSTCRSRWSP